MLAGVLCLLLLLVGSGLGEQARLQIGVKHRVPAEQCSIKSRGGDTLHMHYTGTLKVSVHLGTTEH